MFSQYLFSMSTDEISVCFCIFSSRVRSEQSLVRWATPQLHDIDALAKMVDPALNGMYPAKSLSRFADIIALCVQVNFIPPVTMLICAFGFAVSLQVGKRLGFVPSVDLIGSYVSRPSKELQTGDPSLLSTFLLRAYLGYKVSLFRRFIILVKQLSY